MLIKLFIPIFIVTILFFVLVFELMDAFTNLWRYISQDVGFAEISKIAILYLPKCISYYCTALCMHFRFGTSVYEQ